MQLTNSSTSYYFIILLIGLTIESAKFQTLKGKFRDWPQTVTTIRPSYRLGLKGVGNPQLTLDVKKIRDRLEKGGNIIRGIFDSFSTNGDEETLENALSKYDELLEDVEADLTKTKIAVGLRIEESVKNYQKSADKLFQQFRGFNNNRVSNWNSTTITNGLRKSVLRFNDFLSSGFERFLEMSERGKDVLRRLQRQRYEVRNNVA